MNNQYYIYILANPSNTVLYIGVTDNLIRRIHEHKEKALYGFTKKYNVSKLIYYEVYEDIMLAINREKQLKKWSRGKKESLIMTMNPDWNDLYEGILF